MKPFALAQPSIGSPVVGAVIGESYENRLQ